MVGSNQFAQDCINFAQSKGGFLFGTKGYFGNTVDVTLTATNNSSGTSEDVRVVYDDTGVFVQGTTITTNALFNGYAKRVCAAGTGIGSECILITDARAGVALVNTSLS